MTDMTDSPFLDPVQGDELLRRLAKFPPQPKRKPTEESKAKPPESAG